MNTATSAGSIPAQSSAGVVNSNGGPVIQGYPSAGRDIIIITSSTGQVKDSEAEEIARWLSPLEDQARQKELSTGRCQVGQWLLDSEEFKYWVRGQPWHLRCYGKVGSGKTSLSSILVSHLEETFSSESKPVICLYLNDAESTTHKLEDLFGSLLKQLLQLKKSNPVSAGLRQLYDNAKHRFGGRRNWDDFRALLQDELGTYERVYLVVDALDECNSGTRRSLQTELCRLRPDKLSMMITSRDIEGELDDKYITCSKCKNSDINIYYYCRDCEFDLCQECIENGVHCKDESHKLNQPENRVKINVSMRDEDLEKYITWKLKRKLGIDTSNYPDERRRPPDVRSLQDPVLLRDISSVIVERAEGMALLARLYLDSIEVNECLNQKDIATLLSSFPKKLDQLYEKEMMRILDQGEHDADIAIAALSRVSCARRPLSLPELQHSLATEPGTTNFHDIGIYHKERLLWVTAGLITIDSDGGAVRLVHTSFEEYLEETGAKWFPNSEADMAHICLTYLNFDTFSQPRKEVEDFDPKDYPFIAYASQHWGDHVRAVGPDNHTNIRDLTLRVVNEPLRLAAYMQAAWATDASDHSGWDVREGVTSLHVFAWFGLSSMIPKVIQGGLDVDVRESAYGQTPLMYACRRGHVEVVRQLLDFGAWVNKLSARGRTAMFEAVAQNNEDVVKLLLGTHELLTRPKLGLKAVNPNKFGQTALMLVKLLLGKHELLTRSKLDLKAVNPKGFGQTALMLVKLLLGKHELLTRSKLDLKAVNPTGFGRTALMLAARLGDVGIVQSLLEHPDNDVNQQDTYGYTALSLAAANGFDDVVKLLLKKPDINVNLTNHTGGRSALILAAERNHTEIVKSLLQSGAYPDLKDGQDGGTAIMRAIDYGYTSVIEIMLQFRVNYQCKDDNGRSLLHAASASGLPDIIRLFVEKGLDQNLQDKLGFTPLHDASRSDKPEAIETLLEVGADSTIKDNFGRTPLILAWQYGRTEIMGVLQRKGKTEQKDLVLISKEENLPVWSLVRLGRSKLITDAITAKESNLTAREPGRDDTALHWAIHANQVDILRMLLKTAKMDLNAANHHRRTPLHLTAFYGYSDATSALLNNGAKLEATDRWGATPLSIAHTNQHFRVAIALIEAGARVDAQNIDLQKMFFAAVELKSTRAAEILIDKGANVVAKNSEGRWAMQLAKEAEDEQMITYLKSVKSFPYQADEERSKEGGADVTSSPSPSPEESPYVTSWAEFAFS